MQKKIFKMTTTAIVLLVLLCPAALRAEEDAGGKMVKKRPFAFFLPTKWHTPFLFAISRKRVRGERALAYTKDGFLLDRIVFGSRAIAKPFQHTKKVLAPGMAPFEIAQLVISDLELSKPLGFKVYENQPVTVCGKPGFRIVFSFIENGNLTYQSVYYGFVHRNLYYTIRYLAPAIHYYDTYLPTFEKMVKSASLITDDGDEDDKQDFIDPAIGDDDKGM